LSKIDFGDANYIQEPKKEDGHDEDDEPKKKNRLSGDDEY
jgi:hypothetical protein